MGLDAMIFIGCLVYTWGNRVKTSIYVHGWQTQGKEKNQWNVVLIVVVQSLSCVWPHGLQHTGLPILHYLPEFPQTHVHWVDDAVQPSHPLFPPSPSALNLSQHQGTFQWVGSLHQVAKYWSFSISPSNECSGLISFRIDWFDLLAVWGETESIRCINTERFTVRNL